MNHKMLSAAVLLAVCGIAAAGEKPVKLGELPPAVREAVENGTKGATVRGFSKETENGKVFYEAETVLNGRHRDILFDESGAVTSVEEETLLGSIPAAARSAIEKHAAGGKVLLVETITSEGKTNYEAQVQKAGKKSEVKVAPEGAIVK